MRSLWAFENDNGEVRDFAGNGLTEFTDGPFQGYMDYQEIVPGIGLYRLEGQASADYTLSAAEHSPTGMLILGCMLDGSGRIAANGSEDQDWGTDGRLYALTPYGRRVSYHVSARKPWRSMALKIDANAMARVANDPLPALIDHAVRDGGAALSVVRPLVPGMTRIAEELVRPLYAGRMAALYREAKVLELLALQLDALSDQPHGRTSLSAREAVRVREARDRLLADLRDTPNLHDLAHSVGLSPKRLNQGLRALYGTTAFDLLRDARLDAARTMLDEGQDLPLKQVAWRVGYAHPTNFINAYRRRFGMPPGLHKRLRRDEN